MSSRLRNVLLATDLSANADAALQWAVEIATDLGAQLHLVHASNLAGWSTDYLEITARVPQQIETDTRQSLESLAETCRTNDLEVTCEVLQGEPASAVVSAAQERRAQLIVVGTRGQRGLDYLLLGSTAQRVVQRATCPVVTVHPQDAPGPRPIRRILAATDFSEESRAAIAAARTLAGRGGELAVFLLVHAYVVPYDLMSSDGSVSIPDIPDGLGQWRTAQLEVEERLEAWARPLRQDGLEVETLGLEGYPPEAIIETAVEHRVDLIATGTHGRTGLSHVLLGSTAERVIHKAPCPVLTLRRQPLDSPLQ